MPLRFRILPACNLVHVIYTGEARVAETLAGMADCAARPEFRPWMRQLIDLSAVSGFERNPVGYLALQARSIGTFQTRDLLKLYYAPTPLGQQMAVMARRSWEGLDHVIVRVVTEETEVMSLLGLPGERLADLDASTG